MKTNCSAKKWFRIRTVSAVFGLLVLAAVEFFMVCQFHSDWRQPQTSRSWEIPESAVFFALE